MFPMQKPGMPLMGGNQPQMPAGAFQQPGGPTGAGMPQNAQAGQPAGGMGGFPPMGGGMMPDRAMLAQMLAGRMQGR